ncbi:hypothetical protein [Snodgrassella alvi]
MKTVHSDSTYIGINAQTREQRRHPGKQNQPASQYEVLPATGTQLICIS